MRNPEEFHEGHEQRYLKRTSKIDSRQLPIHNSLRMIAR